MTINFQPLLLRPRAAAQRLGISIEALRNEVRSGKLAQIRVGRMLYLRPEDLVAYVDRLALEAANLRNARGSGVKRKGRMSAGEKHLSAEDAGRAAIAARRGKKLRTAEDAIREGLAFRRQYEKENP